MPAPIVTPAEVAGFFWPDANLISGTFFIVIVLFLLSGLALGLRSWTRQGGTRELVKAEFLGDAEQATLADLDHAVGRHDLLGAVALRLPTIVLVVGLLGTFVGIGIAIQKVDLHSAGAVSGNAGGDVLKLRAEEMGKKVDKAADVLPTLGLKFQTSAWGILTSLILTASGAVLVAQPRRRLVLDVAAELRAERRLRELATREAAIEVEKIRGDRDVSTAEYLRQCSVALNRLVEDVSPTDPKGRLGVILPKVLGALEVVARVNARIEQVDYGQSAPGLAALRGRLDAMLKALEHGVENGGLAGVRAQIATALERLSTLPEAASSMKGAATDISTAVGTFKTDAVAALSKVEGATGKLETSAGKMEAAAGSIGTSVGDAINKFATDTKDVLEGSATKTAEAANEITKAIRDMKSELETPLGQLKSGADEMKTATEGVARGLAAIDGRSKQITSAIAVFQEAVKKAESTDIELIEVTSQLRSRLRELDPREGATEGSLLHLVHRIGTAAEAMAAAVDGEREARARAVESLAALGDVKIAADDIRLLLGNDADSVQPGLVHGVARIGAATDALAAALTGRAPNGALDPGALRATLGNIESHGAELLRALNAAPPAELSDRAKSMDAALLRVETMLLRSLPAPEGDDLDLRQLSAAMQVDLTAGVRLLREISASQVQPAKAEEPPPPTETTSVSES